MKRFLTAIGFCGFFLVCGLIFLSPTTKADGNIIAELLKLPAPPPSNPEFQITLTERTEDFYNSKNPPSDEAPIDELTDYWARQSGLDETRQFTAKPSPRVVERLMGEVEKNPERLTEFLNVFSHSKDGADFVKRMYDRELSDKANGRDWRESVKRWLTYNTPYFSDELLKLSQQVKDESNYVTNQDDLLALAKVDWEKARPIIERLMNDSSQPVSQTLARWAAYQHALDERDSSEAERLRGDLRKTVEDKNQSPGNRDLAMDAIVRGGDFEGRDEWYLKLLEDESLHNLQVNGQTYTGLTTIISHSPEDKYTEKMLELLRSGNRAVRSAVVRNLTVSGRIKNPEVVRELLPWLSDPDWANDVNFSRRSLIYALTQVKMPESVPGLISVLNEKRKGTNTAIGSAANTDTFPPPPPPPPRSTANSNMVLTDSVVENYAYRYEAISALAIQRDIRAVPALQAILSEVEGWQKNLVMTAIWRSGGFTVAEQVDAVEAATRQIFKRQEILRESANVAANRVSLGGGNSEAVITNAARETVTLREAPMIIENPNNPEILKSMLGQQIIQDTEPSDDLVRAMIERISALEKREPNIAQAMRGYMRNWKGTAVNALLLADLQNNKSQTEDILQLLTRRKEIRENQFNDIYAARGGNATALGISSCLLENSSDYDAVLASENAEAKAAMLACARLIRAKIPVGKVAENLRAGNQILVEAAEKYLEAEDSPEARQIVWARHPNEAKILGARTYFGETGGGAYIGELFQSVTDTPYFANYFLYTDFSENEKLDEKLRKEVIENAEILAVYAYDKNFVRVYKDRAVFSWEEDPARFSERVLENGEFARLKSYIESRRAADFPPFLSICNEECEEKELLMMSRNGGRRVFMYGSRVPEFFSELDKIFEEFRRPPAKLKYYLQDKLKGLEILYTDKNLQAETVWKSGADFRILLSSEQRREQIEKEISEQEELEAEKLDEEDYEKRSELEMKTIKRRQIRAYENYLWYRFDGAKISETISQPANVGFIPPRDNASIQPEQEIWKRRAGNFDVRADETGVYKVSNGRMTRLREGNFANPVVTPNGRWAIVKTFGGEEDEYMPSLVRINLLTGKSSKIPLKGYNIPDPLVFVPALNKILLGNATYENAEEYEEEVPKPTGFTNFYLLDAETGAIQPAKENIRPLAQQTFRPLQSVTGKPDEFWTAIPDSEKNLTQIGTFNARTLTFKSLLTIPQIEFDSMKMWVDETENKVCFAYSGQVLSLPLAAKE